MSFKLYSTDDGHVPAWEYLPVSSITPKVGMGLAADATTGLFAPSAVPTHISMRTETDAIAEGTMIPCVKIADDQVWENRLYSDAPNAKTGHKVDLDATGKWVNAKTTENANFLITYLEGNELDDVVRGRFVK